MILLGSLKRQQLLLLCFNSSHLILFWLWLLVCKQGAFCTSYPVSVLLVIYLDSSLRFLLPFSEAVMDRICLKNIHEATKLCPFIEKDHRVLSGQNRHGSLLLWKYRKPCCHNQSSLCYYRLIFLSVHLRGIFLPDLI